MGQTAIPRNSVSVRQLGYFCEVQWVLSPQEDSPHCLASCTAFLQEQLPGPNYEHWECPSALSLSWVVSGEFAHLTIRSDFKSSSSRAVSRGVQLCGLQAQEWAASTDKKQSFRTQYFYIQNGAFLHGNLYSHRDLYIQVAHAFISDGAGTLDHNSLVC